LKFQLFGCNGAGKTTTTFALLSGLLKFRKVIYKGISMVNCTPIEKAYSVGVIQARGIVG
jgi:ABC-type branched-subunit amino acid transport system ATPase component